MCMATRCGHQRLIAKHQSPSFRLEGNEAFQKGDAKGYGEAVTLYTKAIALDKRNKLLWSNR
jgi:hypothetical protein